MVHSAGARILDHAQVLTKKRKTMVKVHQKVKNQMARSPKTKKMMVRVHQTTKNQTVRSQKMKRKKINLKDQLQLVKTVNGKNVKNLMVSWVVSSSVLLTSVNFHVTTVLKSLMVHQRLNASKVKTVPLHGTKNSETVVWSWKT